MKLIHTTCCIVGGGPAGMMLGLLLAKAGIDTVVLEKHADFFRDFRGDTIHPSTLEIIHELGFLDELLKLPHQIAGKLNGYINDMPITIADFSKLSVRCPYIMMLPQWDFLNFLASKAKLYSNFKLLMHTEAFELLTQNDSIVGVQAKNTDGIINIASTLVIAADGRNSIVRQLAGLSVIDLGAPMDVFWFRLTRKQSDPNEMFGKFSSGKIIVMINRQEYWQCGYVIPKGQAEDYKAQSINLFQRNIADNISFLNDRVNELKTWDDVKLLTVKVDRLQKWYKLGLLCVGDAAHAMSPVGGVGINLAIQDAVATANLIAHPLKENKLSINNLKAVQTRRMVAVKIIQGIQLAIQRRIIKSVLSNRELRMPLLASIFLKFPMTRSFIGYLIGMGVRREKIQA